MTLKKITFENIVGKEENAGNQHFLLFPQCFYPSQKEFLFLRCIYCFILLSANAFNLDWSKNLLFGKELTLIMPLVTMHSFCEELKS